MYENLTEEPTTLNLCPHEVGISNRQRNSLRRKPTSVRRQEARQAQKESGLRIRIWRKVLNEEVFADQLRVWHKPQQDGTARRKNYRQFTLTLFDTNQQPLRHIEPYTEEDLREILLRRHATLFTRLAPLAVAGTMRAGNKEQPMIALKFGPKPLDDERVAVRNIIAPELRIDDSHQLLHRPHVSLGRITVANSHDRERITGEIESMLAPVLPKYVELGPARVQVYNDI